MINATSCQKNYKCFPFYLKDFWHKTCESLDVNETPTNSCNHRPLHLSMPVVTITGCVGTRSFMDVNPSKFCTQEKLRNSKQRKTNYFDTTITN